MSFAAIVSEGIPEGWKTYCEICSSNTTALNPLLVDDMNQMFRFSLSTVFESVYGRPPLNDKGTNVLKAASVHENFGSLQQAVYVDLLSKEYRVDYRVSVRHVYTWMKLYFDTVWQARRTILKHCVPSRSLPFRGLEQFEERVKELIPDDTISFQADGVIMASLHRSLDRCYRELPIFALIQKYTMKNEEGIDVILEYFGAEYIKKLTSDGFWDTFPSLLHLHDWIKEASDPLEVSDQASTVITARQAQQALFSRLTSLMDEETRLLFGVQDHVNGKPPPQFDISVMVQTLHTWFGKDVGFVAARREITGDVFFDYVRNSNGEGTNYRQFLKWCRDVITVNMTDASFAKEPHEYWMKLDDLFKRRFNGVEPLGSRLAYKPIKDYGSCVQFFRVLNQWLIPETEKEKEVSQQQRPVLKRKNSNDENQARKKIVVKIENKETTPEIGDTAAQVSDLIKSAHQSCSDRLTVAKQAILNIVNSSSEHLCPLCATLGHEEYMCEAKHEYRNCFLKNVLNIHHNFKQMYVQGGFGRYLIQELVFIHEKLEYTQVYTDTSFTKGRDAYHTDHTGIGVWFGVGDPRNVSLAVKATNSLEGELMAISEALWLLTPEGGNENEMGFYEICTDSLSSINLINGYSESRSDQVSTLVELCNTHKLRVRGQVRFTHVKGHSGVIGNEMADKLAKRGRMKSVNGDTSA